MDTSPPPHLLKLFRSPPHPHTCCTHPRLRRYFHIKEFIKHAAHLKYKLQNRNTLLTNVLQLNSPIKSNVGLQQAVMLWLELLRIIHKYIINRVLAKVVPIRLPQKAK